MMWEIIPNPGRIKIYTSGCPKNQNKCWYKIGSPPPAGSKKLVLIFRSVRSIVIAPAKTGRESRRRTAVIFTLQTNRGIRSKTIPLARMLIIVVMKLIEARMEDTPARCREKIVMSTDGPEWEMLAASGGYTVHPVPAPLSTAIEVIKRVREGGSSQNLRLFIRGKAMSGAPNINGSIQFPNPPIIIGITMKKIITKA